jgi:hypothetical protein
MDSSGYNRIDQAYLFLKVLHLLWKILHFIIKGRSDHGSIAFNSFYELKFVYFV